MCVKFSENSANTLKINNGVSQKMKKVFQKEILLALFCSRACSLGANVYIYRVFIPDGFVVSLVLFLVNSFTMRVYKKIRSVWLRIKCWSGYSVMRSATTNLFR